MWKWLKALNPFESDNYTPWMREEIATLRDQLAAAEIELADLRFYQREFAAVSEVAELKAKRDAVTAEKQTLSDELQRVTAERDALKTEVQPATVPSVEELAKLICQTECATNKILRRQEVEDLDRVVAAAIRDRVLAGVQAAPPPLSDEIIERMAEAMCDATHKKFGFAEWDETAYQDAYRLAARAALEGE